MERVVASYCLPEHGVAIGSIDCFGSNQSRLIKVISWMYILRLYIITQGEGHEEQECQTKRLSTTKSSHGTKDLRQTCASRIWMSSLANRREIRTFYETEVILSRRKKSGCRLSGYIELTKLP